MEWLFPLTHLVVDQVLPTSDRLEIKARSAALLVACPACGTPSARVQGHYLRCPHDLPCGPYPLRLHLKVRRFYCLNPECGRTTFAEGFPGLLELKAQRTTRLQACHAQVGLSLSGEAGANLLAHLSMPIHPETVLNSVKALEVVEGLTPKVLGVDDFAFKRGQKYGTVLVDLEQRRVVDLLPDREALSLATWLKAHPGVETVTRDRYKAYQNGITEGAPEATQVADRWHLLHNLADTVKVWLERYRPLLLEPPSVNPREFLNALVPKSHRHEKTNQIRMVSQERRMCGEWWNVGAVMAVGSSVLGQIQGRVRCLE